MSGFFRRLANYTANGAGAVLTTVQSKLQELPSILDRGALVDNATNNTTALQSALNALPAYGGTVYVNDGAKFNLASLTLPVRCNLNYRADDDLSAPNPGGDIGSSERVWFSANSSYPLDPSGATVNEWRFTAPFHPGIQIDARSDVAGHDAWFRPGQSRTNPVRCSYNLSKNQQGIYRTLLEFYSTYSDFTGIFNMAFRNVYTLSGIGTASYSVVPAENVLLTGNTSGATGTVLVVSAGNTTVLWVSGKFQAGETITYSGGTNATAITTAVFSATPLQSLGVDLKRGNWSVGLPPGSVRTQFAVGGKIASTRSRTAGQYIDDTINDPAFVLVDSFEGAPPNGYELTYGTGVAAALRRPTLRKYGETIDRVMVGTVSFAVIFGNALTANSKAFNTSSITKPATGRYVLTFINALASAEYIPRIVSDDLTLVDRDQRVTALSTANFEVRNYNAAGALADLVGNLYVTIDLGLT